MKLIKKKQKPTSNSRKGLGQLVASFLAPGASELGQTIADQVRLIRWQRSVRILKKAKEFAAEHDVPLQEVPTKFLIPFIEKSSAEDNVAMEERWARLLSSAAQDFDATKHALMNCLASMGSEEAELLKRFAVAKDSENAPFMSALRANLAVDTDYVWNECLDALEQLRTGDGAVVIALSHRLFSHAIERGALPAGVALSTPTLPDNQSSRWFGPIATKQHAIYNLKNLDLISGEVIDERYYKNADKSVVSEDEFKRNTFRFQFMWFQLTALGEMFLKTCEGQTPNAPSHLKDPNWFSIFQEDYHGILADKKRRAGNKKTARTKKV